MAHLLNIWREQQPGTYNVKTLLRVLRQLELRQMKQWIELLMTRSYSDEKHELMNDDTMSSAGVFCHSVTPTLLNTSYSDSLLPTSDKQCQERGYSSDSGLSSACSDFGDTLVRSSISIDIKTGIVTHGEDNTTDAETDEDLIERSYQSVLNTAKGLINDWTPNSSFMIDKKAKFDKKKAGGVYSLLFRPEGKMLARLTRKIKEENKTRLVTRDSKEKIKRVFAALVTLIQSAITSLDYISHKFHYLETTL